MQIAKIYKIILKISNKFKKWNWLVRISQLIVEN